MGRLECGSIAQHERWAIVFRRGSSRQVELPRASITSELLVQVLPGENRSLAMLVCNLSIATYFQIGWTLAARLPPLHRQNRQFRQSGRPGLPGECFLPRRVLLHRFDQLDKFIGDGTTHPGNAEPTHCPTATLGSEPQLDASATVN